MKKAGGVANAEIGQPRYTMNATGGGVENEIPISLPFATLVIGNFIAELPSPLPEQSKLTGRVGFHRCPRTR